MLKASEILPKLAANKVDHQYHDGYRIGFDGGRHVWYWFLLLRDGTLIFDHSYSTNTGKISKSFNAGQRARRIATILAS